ncbi:hypothetical protein CDAR_17651 [Caerostris darwini]|uniref:Uncharacterized protein n=1 Tax=Caerostris darwini TaxID=1538125 RepID=A0AAV4QTC5_9ARAC|nr:hypothetical protein CDAR_17651 [Caerostris darwini]
MLNFARHQELKNEENEELGIGKAHANKSQASESLLKLRNPTSVALDAMKAQPTSRLQDLRETGGKTSGGMGGGKNVLILIRETGNHFAKQ